MKTIMKKLQNNFTNVEQSKRLLELGVPADSADMRYATKFDIVPCVNIGSFTNDNTSTPCWSVGRLMEIYTICSDLQPTWEYCDDIIDDMIECIASDLLEQDFYLSKLEE